MEMRTIIFNNIFNETSSVLNGTKTQMRCRACCGDDEISFCTDKGDGLLTVFHNGFDIAKANYKVGEALAIGVLKRTIDVGSSDYVGDRQRIIAPPLVRYDTEMLHRSIQITRVSIERLQDISEEDCLKEGIWRDDNVGLEGVTYWYHGLANSSFRTAKEAYAALIDKISGKYTWESNPWVFVYDFKLIKDGTNEKR